MTYWDAFLQVVKHPINSISAIEGGEGTAGIGSAIGAVATAGMGGSDGTLQNMVFGTLSGDQKSKIALRAQEDNARAQGPTVYGNFLKMKSDLEAIFKLHDSRSSAADTYGSNQTEPPPDLTNSPWKVLILLGALLVAFGMLRD